MALEKLSISSWLFFASKLRMWISLGFKKKTRRKRPLFPHSVISLHDILFYKKPQRKVHRISWKFPDNFFSWKKCKVAHNYYNSSTGFTRSQKKHQAVQDCYNSCAEWHIPCIQFTIRELNGKNFCSFLHRKLWTRRGGEGLSFLWETGKSRRFRRKSSQRVSAW